MKNISMFKNGTYLNERKLNCSHKNLGDVANLRYEFWKNFLGEQGFLNYNKYLYKNLNIDKKMFLGMLEEKDFDIIESNKLSVWNESISELENNTLSYIKIPIFYIINERNEKEDVMFFSFYEKFIKLASFKLNNKYQLRDMPEIINHKFLLQLLERINNICYRTLILELNIVKENGGLIGSTKEERYTYFNEIYLRDNFWNILEEYPVMFRLIIETIENWIENTIEFLNRFEQDKELLKLNFGVTNHIKDIGLGVSDLHNGGKSVIVITFDNDTKVVYKPINVLLEIKFQDTLQKVNSYVGTDFYISNIISCNSYGWVEYINHKFCEFEEDIKAYYEELGGLLCVLYLFRANDMHYENIIAYGKHPVIVDLETVFHNKLITNIEYTSTEYIFDILENSVRRVGILPSIIWGKKGEEGVDISALTNEGEKYIPIERATIINYMTDEMKVSYKKFKLPSQKNSPYLKNNKNINFHKYKKYLYSGFKKVYLKLQTSESKNILLEDIECYRTLYARQIVRATQFYSSLLDLSYHPDFLRSGLDREMLFSRLWIPADESNQFEKTSSIEKDSLLKCDIPLFYAKIDDDSIFSSNFEHEILNVFNTSVFNLVKQNIKLLNLNDLKLQLSFIKTALDYDIRHNKVENIKTKYNEIPKIEKLDKEQCLKISKMIGDSLILSSFTSDKEDVNWIDMNIIGEKSNDWNMVPLGVDIYSGITGVMIFYIYLYKNTGDVRYFNMVRYCYNTIKHYVKIQDKNIDVSTQILFGGFSGETPIIYALTILEKELGEDFDRLEIIALRSKILAACMKHVNNDDMIEYDIIIGAAGAIGILLQYYDFSKDKQALYIAKLYAEKIIQGVTYEKEGICWKSSTAQKPLGGFAHGTSGISWSLAKLYKYNPDIRYIQIIEKSLEYEASLYVNEKKNWSDLRQNSEGVNYDDLGYSIPVAWCHGASGILLNRVFLKQSNLPLSEEINLQIDQDIKNALLTTSIYGFGRNHCLCHGDMGNIHILKYAADILNDKELDVQCNSYISSIMEELETGRWKCGIPYEYSPGLMVGLAGIGYGMLKLYNNNLPLVLILE